MPKTTLQIVKEAVADVIAVRQGATTPYHMSALSTLFKCTNKQCPKYNQAQHLGMPSSSGKTVDQYHKLTGKTLNCPSCNSPVMMYESLMREQTINDLIAAIERYMDMIAADWSEDDKLMNRNQFRASLSMEMGPKYIRIVKAPHGHRSVHSFVVRVADDKFQVGDVLKADGWKAPARNFRRANVFNLTGRPVRWTGW